MEVELIFNVNYVKNKEHLRIELIAVQSVIMMYMKIVLMGSLR